MKWKLDSFFSGPDAVALAMRALTEQIGALRTGGDFVQLISEMQEIDLGLRECDAFILCLQSQDTADERGGQLRAQFATLDAAYQLFGNQLDAFLVALKDSAFDALVSTPALTELRFVLEERRVRARQKLPAVEEDLITALSVDGYHGWGELYPQLVSGIKIPFQEQELSFGQAENKLSHADRSVRQEVFLKLEQTWKAKGSLFASVLNRIAGFRLEVYARRKWTDPLQEPLFENRMTRATLDAMWHAVEESKAPLQQFLQHKANALGVDKLAWYDLEAPFDAGFRQSYPYAEGAELIINQMSQFHPRMGAFAKRAITGSWVEAEDRPGKRPGGYCTPFPKSRESRIFMTYSGTMDNVSTLAHELGHAWHTATLDDLPAFAQHYRMNVAETASTFAEQILSDALLQQASSPAARRSLLADRIQRSVTFMMNIHARFLFETQFYTQRKKGFLSADELCQVMQEAQQKAYGNALGVYHPYFWAAKLHFYFTDVPFYNFPYTFGYLLSLGMYRRAKQEGPAFLTHYDAFLRESGMMPVEQLAKKHLGVDLTQPAFWQLCCQAAVADVAEFSALV